MSTMQQQAPSAEAVEEQMGKIVTELGAALGVLLTSLGTRSGLWAALAGAGPLTTADVAAKVSVEPSLVREWLRAQAAGGYLVYDPATGTFTLPDAVAAAICYGPGGALVDAAATMFSSMGEGFAAFSEAFSTGQGFGERRAAALLRRQAGPAARLQGPGRHRGADRGAGSRRARSRAEDRQRPGAGRPGQDRAGTPRTGRSPARLAADGNRLRLFARRTRHLEGALTASASARPDISS